ncbi:MAG: hypothetical protein DHS20C18_29590 [Saprospiraceae bacterium]|nr:MAG: hypothetical protein DHS20C18_29590 [Saprospiraceae bacterium]
MMKFRFYTLLLLAAFLYGGNAGLQAQDCALENDVQVYNEGESGDLGGNVNTPSEITFPAPVLDGTNYVLIGSAPDDERDGFYFTVPVGFTLEVFNISEFTSCEAIKSIKVWTGPNKDGTELVNEQNYSGGNLAVLEAGTYTVLIDHDPTPDCSITCYRVQFQFSAIDVETPDAPTIDIQEANACLGATGFGARISVNDPGEGLEVYWRVLQAPAGASFGPGDELPPLVNVSEYRTDQRSRGEWFRLKQSAADVAAGTYTFEAFVKNTSGASSDAVGPFTIIADLLPEVAINYNGAPEGGCPSGATVCSGETTDVSFSVPGADQLIITAIRYDLESSAGGVCAQGAIDGYGPITGGTIALGDNVIGGISQTFVNNTSESVRIAYQVEPRSSTGSMCVGEAKFIGIVVEPQPSFTCLNNEVTLQTNFSLLTASEVVNFENYGNTLDCSYSLVSITPNLVTCDDYNTTVPVEVVVRDGSGNTSSCTAMVFVEKGTALPPGWNHNDIGSANGNAEYDYCDQSFTVQSTGTSQPTGDIQHFAHTNQCGDFEIIAHVSDIEGLGFAGIMARENSSPGARKIAIKTQLSNMLRRDLRTTPNGFAQSNMFFRPGASWLRLVRTGSSFIGYASVDGSNWQHIFGLNLSFASCLEVGLFSEGANANTNTAIFYNVSINSVVALSTPSIDGLVVNSSTDQSQGFQCYPNPATDELNVELKDYQGQSVEILISNNLGQTVHYRQIDETQSQSERFDLNDLNDGIYLVTVRSTTGEQETKKLVVQKTRP